MSALLLTSVGASNGLSAVSPLLDGLLAFWKLDEASGNRLDVTGNGRALVPSGSNALSLESPGKLGDGVAIPFANAKLTLTLSGALSAPPFTLAGWIKSTGSSGGDIWTLHNGNVGEGDEKVITIARQNPSFGLVAVPEGGTGVYYPAPGTTAATGVWHFLRCEMPDTRHLNLYLNNENTPSVAIDTTGDDKDIQTGWLTLVLGNNLSLGNLQHAQDAVGLWNRLLTPTEAALLYNSGTGLEYPF